MIAGQGTIGLELLEQVPGIEAVVVPIGGGGLIGGVACALKEMNPRIRVVGVETGEAALDAARTRGRGSGDDCRLKRRLRMGLRFGARAI